MTEKFDLIALGTGTAASTVASRCRAAGWKVAVVDSRPFGGTCVLRGCDPKKVLVGAAELVDWSQRMNGKGIRGGGIQIDWPKLIRFKKSFTDPVPKAREESFSKRGIAAFHGRARFVAENGIQVDGSFLEGEHIVIATGAAPAKLNIPGEQQIITSDQFLDLERLPKRVTFVGGGYISFEFAHVAARAGSDVHILHRSERPLRGFDPDLVDQLVEATRDIGVKVELNARVEAIEGRSDGLVVRASRDGGKLECEADLVVHGGGRSPEVGDLNLEKANVAYEPRGVSVNAFLQSVSNPRVYAAGDAAASGGLPLTPVASMEGRVVAANLLEGNNQKPDYQVVPTVVFTVPPLASVGLQENAAKALGLKFRTNHADSSGWYSSRRVAARRSGYKVLVEEGSGRILGAHLLGLHAEEIINLFGLAIRFGIRADDLKALRYAYPSSSDDVSYMV